VTGEGARCDVLVAGGGNAALCAAMTAAEAGARVIVAEAAPRAMRGGNSRHTRNLRLAHDGPEGVLTGSYPAAEYLDDLMAVTAGRTDPELARLTVEESATLMPWMAAHGCRFQPALGGTLSLGRTNPFFLGGGKALLNAYYLTAGRLGIGVLYDAEVTGLEIDRGRFTAARLRHRGFEARIEARALVAAAGGFQANLDWLEQGWGPAARNFIVRGTPYARGDVLRLLLEAGAEPVGDADQCHAIALDARAPRFDGGIATRLDSVPFSIVVNREARRFHDEGEDFWPKRYAIWGRLIARQPGQLAFSILDAKAEPLFLPSIYPAHRSDTVEGLAESLGLAPSALRATVDAYNAACAPDGPFDTTILDGRRTRGLSPDKTNWARPIDTPPYLGYPLRPGITFTYLGVRVDADARVRTAGGAFDNVYAAGEIMAGNVLGEGYLAGIGMTIGTVFGRRAGRSAARHV
jgi:tricarballylate dehydrogenase